MFHMQQNIESLYSVIKAPWHFPFYGAPGAIPSRASHVLVDERHAVHDLMPKDLGELTVARHFLERSCWENQVLMFTDLRVDIFMET